MLQIPDSSAKSTGKAVKGEKATQKSTEETRSEKTRLKISQPSKIFGLLFTEFLPSASQKTLPTLSHEGFH